MRTLLWIDSKTIDYLEQQLESGGVVLAQGDTVLGLLAAVSREGFLSLNRIKAREEKPYLLLVHDYKKALDLIEIPQDKSLQFENFMNSCWPGPVTLIFRAKQGIGQYMKAPNGTIAVRVPQHVGLLKLLERFNALFSTSANSSGVPVPGSIKEVEAGILNSVSSIVLNDESEHAQSTAPSTIIDCTGDQVVVVRKGAFPIDTLIAIFGKDLLV